MAAVSPAHGSGPAPYRGLVPYGEADAALFFGREADRQIITANLYASRLTVLYGASGVGKSSVLQAAVVHRLHQDSRQPVVVLNRWHTAPLAGLRQAIAEETQRITGAPAAAGDGEPLVQFLQRCATGMSGPFVIILDQFEEYFVYARADGEDAFAAELARAINSPSCPATFLISLREDALARLDRFERRIPGLFDTYLRLDHLDGEDAREAIVRPLEVVSRQDDPAHPYSAEPALVEEVVRQVQTGRVVMGQVGRGALPPAAVDATSADSGPVAAPRDERIEAPFLQLVMTRLWDEERRQGSRLLRLATLRSLGGAERIVRTHLDGVMSHLSAAEQETAAHIFLFLVTPGGSKIALDVATLASFSGVPPNRIRRVAQRLSDPRLRVLRAVSPDLPAPASPASLASQSGAAGAQPADSGWNPGETRYEIFHDVLAPAVMDWRARYFGRAGFSRGLLLLTGAVVAATVVVQLIPAVPPLALTAVRGVGLVLVNTLPVLQVYRWFSRYLGLTTASLAVTPYEGPNLGIMLGVLLTAFWYASTRWSAVTASTNPLGAITPEQYLVYLVTVMPSVLVAFLTFYVMRSTGQLTYQMFRRFDVGFVGAYLLVCLVLLALTVVGLLGRLPPNLQIVIGPA